MSALVRHVWGVTPAVDRVWLQVAGMRPSMADGRLLMVLKAFIDESIDPSGIIVLAGYVSTAERWAAFSRDWEKLLKPFGTQREDGHYHFKMAEMAATPQRMERVPYFYEVIKTHALLGVVSIIDQRDLRRAQARIHLDGVDRIDWGIADSPYFMNYRCLMDTFHNTRINDPETLELPANQPIDFCFDENTQKRVVLDQWDDYLARRPAEYRALYGSTPRFENDQVFLPLQAADFLAWWHREWAVEYGPRAVLCGSGIEFPFPRSEKTVNVAVMHEDEDAITARLKDWLTEAIEGSGPVRESRPREDPPSPVERATSRIATWLRWHLFRQPR